MTVSILHDAPRFASQRSEVASHPDPAMRERHVDVIHTTQQPARVPPLPKALPNSLRELPRLNHQGLEQRAYWPVGTADRVPNFLVSLASRRHESNIVWTGIPDKALSF